MAALNVTQGGIGVGTPSTVALDPGLRAAAVDPLDNLLLVSSESSGTVSLIDLFSNKVTGTINAVRARGRNRGAGDDRSDRDLRRQYSRDHLDHSGAGRGGVNSAILR